MPEAYIDFETCSRADLPAVDTVRYAKHRSTFIHCVGLYFEPEDVNKKIQRVFNRYDLESKTSLCRQLLTALAEDDDVTFVAHNVFFDRMIWKHVMHKKLGYPDIPLHRWRCTMAKAYKYGLPGSLHRAAVALELVSQKDMEGKQGMLRLAKPLKKKVYSCPIHKAPVSKPCCGNSVEFEFHTPEHFPTDFGRLYSYCIQDVLTMVELDRFLPNLSMQQQRIWMIEQKINERGLQIDFELVEKAIEIVEAYRAEEIGEYRKITDGKHDPSQRKKLLAWLNDEKKLDLPNTKKQTIQPLLLGGRVACDIKRAIELVLSTNKSSLAKYVKMAELCDATHVVYNLIQYHAAHTMRFGGRGIQPQNLPRPTVKDVSLVLWLIEKADYDLFKLFFGERVAEALSSALRSMIIARYKRKFLIGDYKQIEARLTSYFAGQDWKLDWFRNGVDTYCKAAEPIYGYAVDATMTKERQTGKAAELGLGFGGGIAALVRTAKQNGVDLSKIARGIIESATPDEIRKSQYCIDLYYRNNTEDPVDRDTALAAEIIKRRWRDTNPEIVDLWDAMEVASVKALRKPGKSFSCANGKLTWRLEGCFLNLYLPNKAFISYFKPKLHYDDRDEPYWSYATADPKEPRKYVYGGYLTENAIQFAAASIMCSAMVRLDKHGYTLALTVHDEIICEEPLEAELEHFTKLMEVIPPGFDGLPLDVDSKEATRYGK